MEQDNNIITASIEAKAYQHIQKKRKYQGLRKDLGRKKENLPLR